MAITNYAELQAAVAKYLIDEELDGEIPTMIALGESAINTAFANAQPRPPRPLETRTTLSISSEYHAQPTRFITPKRVEITGLSEPCRLKFTSDDNMAQMKAAEPSRTGVPEFYSIVGDELRFWPVPTTTYTLDLTYYARLAALAGDDDTNWLLDDHPNVYLYATLAHAADFIDDPEKVDRWGGLFTRFLDGAVAAYPTPTDNAPLRTDIGTVERWDWRN